MALFMIVGPLHPYLHPNHQIPVATTTKEIEKEDDRPMNEEEIEIETNDPTIKALIKRINRMEEQIHELGFRIDRLESNESKPKPN
jgi:predicted RNase H-like nuclease (RuvC/YqgF family)